MNSRASCPLVSTDACTISGGSFYGARGVKLSQGRMSKVYFLARRAAKSSLQQLDMWVFHDNLCVR